MYIQGRTLPSPLAGLSQGLQSVADAIETIQESRDATLIGQTLQQLRSANTASQLPTAQASALPEQVGLSTEEGGTREEQPAKSTEEQPGTLLNAVMARDILPQLKTAKGKQAWLQIQMSLLPKEKERTTIIDENGNVLREVSGRVQQVKPAAKEKEQKVKLHMIQKDGSILHREALASEVPALATEGWKVGEYKEGKAAEKVEMYKDKGGGKVETVKISSDKVPEMEKRGYILGDVKQVGPSGEGGDKAKTKIEYWDKDGNKKIAWAIKGQEEVTTQEIEKKGGRLDDPEAARNVRLGQLGRGLVTMHNRYKRPGSEGININFMDVMKGTVDPSSWTNAAKTDEEEMEERAKKGDKQAEKDLPTFRAWLREYAELVGIPSEVATKNAKEKIPAEGVKAGKPGVTQKLTEAYPDAKYDEQAGKWYVVKNGQKYWINVKQ